MRPKANPWGANISGYLKSVQEGGAIYFQNCVFCHGANLNARGSQNYASNPVATNFMQIRTVLYIDEGHRGYKFVLKVRENTVIGDKLGELEKAGRVQIEKVLPKAQ